jgi:hypothetical protein
VVAAVSFLSSHRPAPESPQPSTVVADPATADAARDDYDHRAGLTSAHPHPSSYDAQPHTSGRRG